MPSTRTLLLNKDAIAKKLERMAYELVESNYDEKEIILAGVNVRGKLLAEDLSMRVNKIGVISSNVIALKINAADPLNTENNEELPELVNNKVLVLVDDVANTGRTLLYGMKPFLQVLPKKIQVAVLVDRLHKTYPVQSDFVGMRLSTTLQEHVHVEVVDDEITGVYLV